MIISRHFENREEEDKYINEVKKFISEVNEDTYKDDDLKERIENYYMRVTRITANYRMDVVRFNRVIENWDNSNMPGDHMSKMISSNYKTKAELLNAKGTSENMLEIWMGLCEDLDRIRAENRNFNKNLCFSNIRELIKENPDVKIGKIESAAGIRLGYMSRLEKVDTASEPSMEFVVTAAKLLNVTVDTLIYRDLSGLSENEKYLVKFIEKLKSDTITEKIKWGIQTKFELDRYETNYNGESIHPLFSMQTFYRQSECEYPDEVTDNVYVSKTFGPNTSINGDCYNLKLKNGSTLYLMDIVKDVHRVNDKSAFVKEAVIYVPRGKTQVVATTKDESPIGELLEELYSIVKDNMKHPPVNEDAMSVIDAFMNDDIEDDPLPF